MGRQEYLKAWYERNRESHLKKQREYARAHKAEHRLISRRCHLKNNFDMDAQQFDALLEKQGGACAICKAKEPGGRGTWSIDHDHKCCPGVKTCGKCIRGLLCNACNRALGGFRDSPELLASAIEYLKQGFVCLGS